MPPVLLSGHHARIRQWRRQQQLRRTAARRPDLLRPEVLTREDIAYLRACGIRLPDAPASPRRGRDSSH